MEALKFKQKPNATPEAKMVKMLRNVPIFDNLSDDELEAVKKCAVTRNFPKNSVIINEGDSSGSLYIILKGRVTVFLSDENGKEVILNSQGEGSYFGELALVDDDKRSASVVTAEKSTFIVISKADFKKVLSSNPELAFNLIRGLTHRVRDLTDNVRSLALLDVYGRVAKTLLSLAEEKEDELVIDMKLTQQDIANRVGASREMVAKILKDLTVGGYISSDHKRITIHERLPSHY
ncbi:cAMP-binding proteins - catabolite gene activator and regulatory subunit of cAMP-dependent protein kinases [hydrothermal vent metagenome]|uniref:cAMP-binding proteins - catabolite gene activator and regulatory subunit of cAMP-dependent protein kinases n=1 Tax=hydrothermal vent metagenome TaxID=652676 RepID=A0A3B0ZW81_9ZZZZ